MVGGFYMKRTLINVLSGFVLFLCFTGCQNNTSKSISIPNPVTNFKAVSQEGKIILTWVDPSDSDLLGVKIYNGSLVTSRIADFSDAILVGKGIQHYEVSNLEDGKTYTFKISAVNTDLYESQVALSSPVVFKLKVIEKEVEVEIEKPVYICPNCQKEFETPVAAMTCCGEKIVFINSVKQGTYTVYHMMQNTDGGTTLANYFLNESEADKTVTEESSILSFKKEYPGFEASLMAYHEDNVFVFYNRKTINYSFDAGLLGTFEDGSSKIMISGLYGCSVVIPYSPSGKYKFVRWCNDLEKDVPLQFGTEDLSFNAVWIDDFVSIEYAAGEDFCISPVETTYSWWHEVLQWSKENGYIFSSEKVGTEGNTGNKDEPTDGVNIPVSSISWRDAVVWCNAASEKAGLIPVYEYDGKILKESQNNSIRDNEGLAEKAVVNTSANGYRLPTYEEWQYAAKGGQNFLYSGSDNPDDVAWYGDGVNMGVVHNVSEKLPNGYGLYDMSGNVWEWVQTQDIESEENPFFRIVCGGSYFGTSSDSLLDTYQTRSPSRIISSFGFRVVRTIGEY